MIARVVFNKSHIRTSHFCKYQWGAKSETFPKSKATESKFLGGEKSSVPAKQHCRYSITPSEPLRLQAGRETTNHRPCVGLCSLHFDNFISRTGCTHLPRPTPKHIKLRCTGVATSVQPCREIFIHHSIRVHNEQLSSFGGSSGVCKCARSNQKQ